MDRLQDGNARLTLRTGQGFGLGASQLGRIPTEAVLAINDAGRRQPSTVACGGASLQVGFTFDRGLVRRQNGPDPGMAARDVEAAECVVDGDLALAGTWRCRRCRRPRWWPRRRWWWEHQVVDHSGRGLARPHQANVATAGDRPFRSQLERSEGKVEGGSSAGHPLRCARPATLWCLNDALCLLLTRHGASIDVWRTHLVNSKRHPVRLTLAGHSPAFVSLALALWWYLLHDRSTLIRSQKRIGKSQPI
eukprot:COSAG01_NODE_4748_length_4768_cov_63.686228_3_plen_249_part_00